MKKKNCRGLLILKISNIKDIIWHMFAVNFTEGSPNQAAYKVQSFIFCVANNNLRYVLASACE